MQFIGELRQDLMCFLLGFETENGIGDDGMKVLAECLPRTQIRILNVEGEAVLGFEEYARS